MIFELMFFSLVSYRADLMCIYFDAYNIWNNFLLLVQFLVITQYILEKNWSDD